MGTAEGGPLSALALHGLAAGYGGAPIVRDIELAIAPGEIFCLLGGSGSGKTTLLRCIGGFVSPSAGQVVLDGQDVTRQPPQARDLTTLFQSYALFPHMDVAANIAFGLRRRGMGAQAASQRVAEMLALVRLDGLGARRISQLSGGQMQRVALARCLAPNPRLLLLDEPLSALDPELRAATRVDLVATLRSQGITAILVTHDRAETLAVADRIGLLQGGRLVQVGTPEDLFERPANRFVAGFLGDVVLLDAVVRQPGAISALQLAGGGAVRAGPCDLTPGTKVTLALRPERLRIATTGEGAPGSERIEGQVEAIAYSGAMVDVSLRLAGGGLVRVVRPAELARPVPGERAWVAWEPAHALVLAD